MNAVSRKKSIASKSVTRFLSELNERGNPARGQKPAPEVQRDVVGRSEQALQEHGSLEEAVKRVVGGEADSGEYLLAVSRNRSRGAAGRRLCERGRGRVRLVAGGA